jgi:hypothetical protein
VFAPESELGRLLLAIRATPGIEALVWPDHCTCASALPPASLGAIRLISSARSMRRVGLPLLSATVFPSVAE